MAGAGVAGTPLTEMVMKEGFSAKLFQKAASLAHLGVPEADDIAAMITFLAGPQAARITGQPPARCRTARLRRC